MNNKEDDVTGNKAEVQTLTTKECYVVQYWYIPILTFENVRARQNFRMHGSFYLPIIPTSTNGVCYIPIIPKGRNGVIYVITLPFDGMQFKFQVS